MSLSQPVENVVATSSNPINVPPNTLFSFMSDGLCNVVIRQPRKELVHLHRHVAHIKLYSRQYGSYLTFFNLPRPATAATATATATA